MTPLCETVTGRSMAELIAARDAAVTGDMVELRLDGVANLDVARALHGRRVPAVVTCRAMWEGGHFDGTEDERRAILATALDLGAEFVDVEWRAVQGSSTGVSFRDLVERSPERIVVSTHDFDGVPPDLESRARAMRATGAGTIKIAVSVSRLSQTLSLKAIAKDGPAVVIGMGESGVPSRLLAGRLGSRWTYAGHGLAPGQLPARQMIDDYGFSRVSDSTRIFGVVSTNALHSLSPVMHNAAFQAAGIDAVYVPLPVQDFSDFLAFADDMNVEGVSVTIPFKLDALRAARSSDALAKQVGAANTLRNDGGGWEATNTDVEGFLRPLETAWEKSMHDVRASVLGGGGAARAVIVALASRGARVTVHARREDQARELAVAFNVTSSAYPPESGSWDLLVNCTPLGGATRRSESPMPADRLTGQLVYDLTYGPGEPPLLRDARVAGLATIDGLAMLVAQAEQQFEWWTGEKPKPGVMEAAAGRRLGEAEALNDGMRERNAIRGTAEHAL
jgi:3-dehydroquinate dehydratase/shikimate dehydrogenase